MKLIWIDTSCILLFFTVYFIPAAKSQVNLSTFLDNEEIASAHLGFCVRDVQTDKILFSHNAEKLFTTASTMKLITTYVAIKELGEEYTFTTEIHHTGIIKEDTLKGDLIIIGGGDPTLGSDDFLKSLSLDELLDKLLELMMNAHITYVTGDIIVDNSRYDIMGESDQWPWHDIGNYYGTTAQGLNIHENYYSLYFNRSNSPGATTSIAYCSPKVDSIIWDNQVTTGTQWSGDQAYIYGNPFSWERLIRGTVPAGNSRFAIKGSLPYPALHFGLWLKERFSRGNVEISGQVETTTKPYTSEVKSLGVISSPPLDEILRQMNERSVNLYAEAILKEIAYHNNVKGSTEAGLTILAKYLKDAGLDENEFHLVDGSGLSPFNVITPGAYTALLTSGMREEGFSQAFANVMAIYGRTGTLRYLFNNSTLDGNAIGKSGSITGVHAYTGILETSDGKQLAFSFFLDNFYGSWQEVRGDFEKLMTEIAVQY